MTFTSLQLLGTTVVQILSVFPSSAPIGAVGSVTLAAWQASQIEKLRKQIEFRIKGLDQRKIDRTFVNSDEFKELVIQLVRVASETASENKQQALANALVNSAYRPISAFKGKYMLLRILSQLSDEEIALLRILVERQEKAGSNSEDPDDLWEPGPETSPPIPKHNRPASSNETSSVAETDIMNHLPWSREELRMTLTGLQQLGLIYDTTLGRWSAGVTHWALTPLAERFMTWCSEVPHE